MTIYPVIFEGHNVTRVVLVAFSRAAAEAFIAREQAEFDAEMDEMGMDSSEMPLFIEECPLIDNYGFHCGMNEISVILPHVAKCTVHDFKHFAPEYFARKEREYIREMSMGG